jgi:hypothetical protein
LKDDRAGERLEVGPFAPNGHSAGTDGLDHAGEHWIDPLEVADRSAIVGHRLNLRVGRTDRGTAQLVSG